MRSFELTLAMAAITILPVVAGGRILAWFVGPFAQQRALEAIQSAAPEIAPEDGYVSSRDCRGCHPEPYASWHDSYHRTMTQLATPKAVVGDFGDIELAARVPPNAPGGPGEDRFRLSRRGAAFWLTWLSPDPREPDRETRIVMTTGSHHHQIPWVTDASGRLITLPWTWLIAEKRWIPRTDAFLAPPDDAFGLSYWSDVCIECHSTQGRPRVAAAGAGDDAQVAELGIACESCHGPGGPHVAANRPPWRRDAKSEHDDPTLVNPEDLSALRASYVCGRCHSVLSYPKSDPVGGHWNDFRPGDDLLAGGPLLLRPESGDPAQRRAIAEHERAERGRFVRERFWADGVLRVTGRELGDVLASPCFAGGEFSCLSCHSMHDYESTDDQLKPGMRGDDACTGCHAEYAGDASLHTRHAPESPGSRCMNCHMPYTTYGLLKAIRSHRVGSPSVAAELATGRPNACNACHLDQSLAWTQEQLARDYGAAPVALDESAARMATGPRWIATGDAGVRALAAWYLGWEPARAASGSDWMAPYLAELLADPYAAVRGVAFRSLHSLPGQPPLAYDFVEARGTAGDAARRQVLADWADGAEGSASRALGPLFDREAWAALLAARDERPISLSE